MVILALPFSAFAGSYDNIRNDYQQQIIKKAQQDAKIKKEQDARREAEKIASLPKNGHEATVNNFFLPTINLGAEALQKSTCKEIMTMKGGAKRASSALACQQAYPTIGIGGNLQCASCSGEWTYRGCNFSSQDGQITNMLKRTTDGYDIEASITLLTVSHRSLGYRVVYRIDNFREDAKFSVIEVTIPTATSEVAQYLGKRGTNVSLNSTYKAINNIWQNYAATNQGDALSFAAALISNPDLSERLITNYFAKK